MPDEAAKSVGLQQIIATYWPVLACSFLIALIATPVCRALALRLKIVDRPDDWLKPHAKPIPYLGGVAIYLAWAGGIAFAIWRLTRPNAVEGVGAIALNMRMMIAVLAGGTVIMMVGLFDDLRIASPKFKLAGNIVVALILITGGLGHDFLRSFFGQLHVEFGATNEWMLWLYSVPLAIFIVVGACNATNLLDGLDGLCSGVLAIISAGFLVLAIHMHTHAGQWPPQVVQRVVIALAMMGGALGFLPYNRNPASIFMGDAGSILLGFNAAVMILMFAEAQTFKWMMGAIVVVGLPIADMVLTLMRRWRAQRPLMQGDRSHFYDQLRDRGYSVKQVVVISYVLAAVFAGVGSLTPIFLRTVYAPLVYAPLIVAVLVAIKLFRMVRVDSPVATDKSPKGS